MTGTFWLNIDGTTSVHSDELHTMMIEDRESLFQSVFAQDNCPDLTNLSLIGLADLNLPHGSATPEIYKAARKYGVHTPTPGVALRVLVQHPNIFRSTVIDNKPVEGCLIGIEPILAPSGKKYVIELAEFNSQPVFRFRRADDDIGWPNYEYWAFAT